jgi:fructose-1,6-bisphosphatase II
MGSNLNDNIPLDLAFDLVRSTEAAALSAGRWMGLGKPEQADRVATTRMLASLKCIDIDGRIAVCETGVRSEGDSRQVPILKHGLQVGTGNGPRLDVVVDAIDGSAQLSQGSPGALSAAAVAPSGSMWVPMGAVYMNKIIVDADVAPALVPQCLDAPAAWTLALVGRAKNRSVATLTVFVLDRPRHKDLIDEIRAAGAHVMLAPDGDIAGGLMACLPGTGIDLLMGIGGVVEGLISACAVKATKGAMLVRLAPQREEENGAIVKAGFDSKRILTHDDLVTSDKVFFAATGINDGAILSGVKYEGEMAKSNSLLLRGETKTRRIMHSEHLIDIPEVTAQG